MIITSSTTRVYLKSLAYRDSLGLERQANDKTLSENIALVRIPYPYFRADAISFIRKAREAALANKEFHFAIILKKNKKLIGILGLRRINSHNKECSFGYWLGKDYRRKGYAKESINLLFGFAFNKLGFKRVTCTVFANNTRSIQVLKAAGFIPKRAGINLGHRKDLVDLILLRKNYQKLAR